jgi:hypothetical protein
MNGFSALDTAIMADKNQLCINGINTMSPTNSKENSKRRKQKVESTAERNQEKIMSYLKDGYK